MNSILKGFLSGTGKFFGKKKTRRLLYLVALCLFTLSDFLHSGLVRRTFVFYSSLEGKAVIEERMLHRSSDREKDIRRYVDEALLGPVSPNSAPLFPRDTRLHSFMYRDSVVYADLIEAAVYPNSEVDDIFRSLLTLNEGIRRNFLFVKDVRLYIGGNEVFFEEFRGIFPNPADNSKTSP